MAQKLHQEIKKFLKENNFRYQQHAENMIVDLLIEYPSLHESLKEAGERGVKNIFIGKPAHRCVKPILEISGKNAIFRINC